MAQLYPSTRGRPDRVTAIRFLSDDAEIVSIRADLDALAADITAEHPHWSRSLHASAHDLTLTMAVDDRRHRYQHLCDGLAGLETL